MKVQLIFQNVYVEIPKKFDFQNKKKIQILDLRAHP